MRQRRLDVCLIISTKFFPTIQKSPFFHLHIMNGLMDRLYTPRVMWP